MCTESLYELRKKIIALEARTPSLREENLE